MSLRVFKTILILQLAVSLLLLGACQGAMPEDGEPQTTAPALEASTEEAVAEPTSASAATATDEPIATGEAVVEEATEAVASPDEAVTQEVQASPGMVGDIGVHTTSPLFSGVTLETLEAVPIMPDPAPRHLAYPALTVLKLEGYPDTGNYLTPQIAIYPIAAYESLSLQAEQQVARLQALLDGGDLSSAQRLPYLPLPNAVPIVQVHVQTVTFENGAGVRYLTQMVQDTAPVVSSSLVYTFQGITDDGQFWVATTLPVASEALPADIATAQQQGFDAAAYTVDDEAYSAYLAEQQARLETLDEEDFSPSLAQLDAFITSLDLSQHAGPAVAQWAPEVAPAPDQVVAHFLESYVEGGGFLWGAHEESDALHADFAGELWDRVNAATANGSHATTYDPLLMIAVPGDDAGAAGFGFSELDVRPASIDGETAMVMVWRRWHDSGVTLPLRFTLQWNGEAWQITGVTTLADFLTPQHPEPVAATERLMMKMVAAAGQFDSIEAWLTNTSPEMVHPNATLALCDAAWPTGFAIEGSFVQPPSLLLSSNVQEEALVVVHLPVAHSVLTVRLVRDDGPWQVQEMVCGDTPQGRALAFYSWYLGVAAQAGETRWAERVPTVDDMNEGHLFVTSDFLRRARANQQEDAYLPSGRVPDRFGAEPVNGMAPIEAQVIFEYREEGQGELQTVALAMVQEDGVWRIDDVTVVE